MKKAKLNHYKQKLYTPYDSFTTKVRDKVAHFIHHHSEKNGDDIKDIQDTLDYAMSKEKGKGGLVITCTSNLNIIGTVVVIRTDMVGNLPKNILVYIAVHSDYQEKGIRQVLMQYAIRYSDGDVALHVKEDNPKHRFYKKLGFEEMYLEMRHREAVN